MLRQLLADGIRPRDLAGGAADFADVPADLRQTGLPLVPRPVGGKPPESVAAWKAALADVATLLVLGDADTAGGQAERLAIVRGAAAEGVGRVCLLSSQAVAVGSRNPAAPFHREAEAVLQQEAGDWTILRLGLLPGERLAANISAAWLHPADLVAALAAALIIPGLGRQTLTLTGPAIARRGGGFGRETARGFSAAAGAELLQDAAAAGEFAATTEHVAFLTGRPARSAGDQAG